MLEPTINLGRKGSEIHKIKVTYVLEGLTAGERRAVLNAAKHDLRRCVEHVEPKNRVITLSLAGKRKDDEAKLYGLVASITQRLELAVVEFRRLQSDPTLHYTRDTHKADRSPVRRQMIHRRHLVNANS